MMIKSPKADSLQPVVMGRWAFVRLINLFTPFFWEAAIPLHVRGIGGFSVELGVLLLHDDFIGEKVFFSFSHHLTMGTGGSSASALHASLPKKPLTGKPHGLWPPPSSKMLAGRSHGVWVAYVHSLRDRVWTFQDSFLTFGSLSAIRRRR